MQDLYEIINDLYEKTNLLVELYGRFKKVEELENIVLITTNLTKRMNKIMFNTENFEENLNSLINDKFDEENKHTQIDNYLIKRTNTLKELETALTNEIKSFYSEQIELQKIIDNFDYKIDLVKKKLFENIKEEEIILRNGKKGIYKYTLAFNEKEIIEDLPILILDYNNNNNSTYPENVGEHLIEARKLSTLKLHVDKDTPVIHVNFVINTPEKLNIHIIPEEYKKKFFDEVINKHKAA